MKQLRRFHGPVVLATALLAHAAPASAVDKFEIQVYDGAINAPWEVGVELHLNYTFAGRSVAEYDGEVVPDRAMRFTLEPALGITQWFEIGFYLQSYVQPDAGFRSGGFKVRTKFMIPERLKWPIILGVNVEIGRVPHSVEEHGWANEFRPIIGWRGKHLLAVVNPIVGFALSGPEAFKPHLEPAFKLAVNTQHWVSAGLEYYMGLGLITQGFDSVNDQEHLLFLAFDLTPPPGRDSPWEFNLGLGAGLSEGTAQRFLVKAILGRSF